MRICFLVGSVDISGGTYVIFQHADYARLMGHDVTIAVQNPFGERTFAWHPAARQLRVVPFGAAEREPYDLVIATWWRTALELHRFNGVRYAYFVQSIESRFYPVDEKPVRALVESTYALPVSFVTEATWIQEYLRTTHGQEAALVRNGIRKDLYTADGKRLAACPPKEGLRVLVEGPFGVFFKNTGRAIRLAKRGQRDDIWLLTSSDISWLPGVHRVFSRVEISRVPEIYRSCDVLLKLSYVEGMFGPPLEMFHCGGTAIVYDVTGHDEYIVHGRNALVAKRGDENQVLGFLDLLRTKPAVLAELKFGALKTAAAWPDWRTSSSAFLSWAESTSTHPTVRSQDLETHNAQAWATYAAHERARLGKSPWILFNRTLHSIVNRMPRPIAKWIRTFRYLGDCYL